MERRRHRSPARDLRVEFGPRELHRALALACLRLAAFAALGALGTQFLIG